MSQQTTVNHKGRSFCLSEFGDRKASGTHIATAGMAVTYDKAANLEKYVALMEVATERGVGLLVLPEQSLQGYLWFTQPSWTLEPEVFDYQYQNAEPIPGPSTEILTRHAKRLNMHVVFGMTERDDSYGGGTGRLYNAAVLLGPDGVIGTYHKVHTPGGEKHIYAAGGQYPVFETPIGRIGILICHDNWFPEVARSYAINGAEMIVMPTGTPGGDPLALTGLNVPEYWGYAYELMQKARAIENQVWFVSSNCTGRDARSGWDFYGHSYIIHPTGVTLANTGKDEGLAIAYGCDVRGEVFRARTRYLFGSNLLFDRVPGTYGAVTGTPNQNQKEPLAYQTPDG